MGAVTDKDLKLLLLLDVTTVVDYGRNYIPVNALLIVTAAVALVAIDDFMTAGIEPSGYILFIGCCFCWVDVIFASLLSLLLFLLYPVCVLLLLLLIMLLPYLVFLYCSVVGVNM